MSADGRLTRRTAIAAGGGVVGAALIAACGSGGGSGGSGGYGGGTSPSTGGDTGRKDGSSADGPLAKVAEVPVGGSVRVEAGGEPVILSQPKKGTIMAFSAICTHQGCTVGADGAKLVCPCHGSEYDAANGEVLHGPAPRALKAIPVEVDGGNVVESA